MPVGPSDRFCYYAGYDLFGTAEAVSEFTPPMRERGVQETTGPANTEPTHSPTGFENATDIEATLWANSAIQDVLDMVHKNAGAAERVLVFGINGDAVGNDCTAVLALDLSVSPEFPNAELTEIPVTWRPNGGLMISQILHDLSAETADGDTESSSIDNGGSSSDGGDGFFLYTNLNDDGGDGFAPRVVDSTDDVTFGELIAFTTVDDTTTTYGAEHQSVDGTVEQHVACDWSFTGTPGGSETCTFFICFHRN